MNPSNSVVIIRTRQIFATGLTLSQAQAESRQWNQGATPDDCATWEPAPAGVRLREGEPWPRENEEADSD